MSSKISPSSSSSSSAPDRGSAPPPTPAPASAAAAAAYSNDEDDRTIAVESSVLPLADPAMLDFLFAAASSETSPALPFLNSAATEDDKLLLLGKLFAAVSFRLHEKSRIAVADASMGGDVFKEDTARMLLAASEYDALLPGTIQYTADELAMLKKTLAVVSRASKTSHKRFKTKTRLVTVDVSDTGNVVLVSARAEIRAPISRIVPFLMGHHTQNLARALRRDEDVIARPNEHSVVKRRVYRSPPGFLDREGVFSVVLKKVSEQETIIVLSSCDHPNCLPSSDRVRISAMSCWTLRRIGPTLTSVEDISQINLGVFVPKAVSTQITVPATLSSLLDTLAYFSYVRPADAYDSGDAKELGLLLAYELIPHRKNEHELRDRLDRRIALTAVLRSAQAKYRFLDELIYNACRNQLSKSVFIVKSSLATLTSDEARRIGKSFTNILVGGTTVELAVDEWIANFLALRQLSSEFPWFQPMMCSMATELLRHAKFGLKVRAYVGAALSIGDMVSDIYVINLYISDGRTAYVRAMVALLSLNILAQLVLVWVQNRRLTKDRWSSIIREWLYVLILIKPGVDAYNAASGEEQKPGTTTGAIYTLVWGKNVELFTEAIPGMVIQCKAFVESKNKTHLALLSLLLSACSASMTSASSIYDLDTNVVERRDQPDSFGMIPDSGRTQAFAVLFLLAFFQILSKGFAVALLAITNTTWLLFYMTIDVAILIVYKLIRRDFLTWHPLPSSISVPFSFVMRIATKVIADFSGGFIARVPAVLGGAFYSFNTLLTHASALVAVHAYNKYAEDSEESTKINELTTWTVATIMTSLWVLAFAFFYFRVCVPKYRNTFYSMAKGNAIAKQIFLRNTADEYRIRVFAFNREHWRDVEDEVRSFTSTNWRRWVETKPDWFTAAAIATVPDDFIPPEERVLLGGDKRLRRASAVGSVRDSLRAMNEATTKPDSG